MQEILIRACCFVAIIFLGYGLRKIGVFKEEDFKVLSKIVVKITLPAAIIYSSAGKAIDPGMLAILLLGFLGGVIYVASGYLLNIKAGKDRQAFAMVNTSGYNIGNFTLPFVQSFLGPIGVITTSLFDTGNAFVCLGGSYGVASMVKENSGFSFKRIGKALFSSVPFICYIIMITLNLLRIALPSPVVSLAEIIGNANAFMAMLMIGVGFKLGSEKSKTWQMIRILAVRYGIALILALGSFYLLPFSLEIRQALMILFFSPISSVSPAFTQSLKGDVGLASAINSMSIIISVICIVSILLITL